MDRATGNAYRNDEGPPPAPSGAPASRPGRRLLAVAVAITFVLSAIAAGLAWEAYQDERARVLDTLVDGSRGTTGDAAQVLASRQEVLGTLADNIRFLEADPERVGARLALVPLDEQGFTAGLAWVGPRGAVRVARGTRPVGRIDDPALAAAVATAVRTGEPYVAEAVPPSLFDEWAIVVVAPVADASGEPSGALVAGLGLVWVNDVASRLAPGRGESFVIVDRAGMVVVAPSLGAPRAPANPDILARVRAAPDEAGSVRTLAAAGVTGPDGAPDQAIGMAFEPNLTGWTTVVSRDASEAFADARRTLLWQLGGLAALAVILLGGAVATARRLDRLAGQRDALLRDVRAGQSRASFLVGSGQALDGERGVHARTERLARLCVPRLADVCVVELYADGDDPPRRAVAARDPAHEALMGRLPEPLATPVADRAARTRAAQVMEIDRAVVERAYGEDPEALEVHDAVGVRVAAAVPLVARGRVIGTVKLCRLADAPAFTPDELRLAERLAGQAALQVENARLYDRERRIAGILQRSLLPADLPEPVGVALAAVYRPAGEGEQAGGDWYDAVLLDDGRLAVTVGDVVGRGTRAAAVMGQLRAAMRSLALEHSDPVTVLTRLSRYAETIPDARVATAAYAVIDPKDGAVAYGCAGHPPPVLVEGDRARHLEEGRGGPLAAWPGVSFSEGTCVLPPGAALLLYTDGLIERRGELIDVSLDRLLVVAGRRASANLVGFCDGLIADLGAAAVDDDVAVLIVRREDADAGGG